jgi:hypothetical protein
VSPPERQAEEEGTKANVLAGGGDWEKVEPPPPLARRKEEKTIAALLSTCPLIFYSLFLSIHCMSIS